MLVDRGSKNILSILSILSVLSVFVFVCWVVHLLIFTDSCTSWRTLADIGGQWARRMLYLCIVIKKTTLYRP